MAQQDPSLIGQFEAGLPVLSGEGEPLGEVVEVWRASEPAEQLLAHSIQDRQMSYDQALELQQGIFLEVRPALGEPLYIPWQAVREVSNGAVTLAVDDVAADASEWDRKPSWIDNPNVPAPPPDELTASEGATDQGGEIEAGDAPPVVQNTRTETTTVVDLNKD